MWLAEKNMKYFWLKKIPKRGNSATTAGVRDIKEKVLNSI